MSVVASAAVKAWMKRRGHQGQSQDSRNSAAVMLRHTRNIVRGGAGRGITRGGVRSAKSLLNTHARTVVKPVVAMASLRRKGLVKKSMESFANIEDDIRETRALKGEDFLARHSARHYAARSRVREVLTRTADQLREKLGYTA